MWVTAWWISSHLQFFEWSRELITLCKAAEVSTSPWLQLLFTLTALTSPQHRGHPKHRQHERSFLFYYLFLEASGLTAPKHITNTVKCAAPCLLRDSFFITALKSGRLMALMRVILRGIKKVINWEWMSSTETFIITKCIASCMLPSMNAWTASLHFLLRVA